MTPFQILAISLLIFLLGREFRCGWRGPGGRLNCWLRGAVWLAAAVAIARPDWVQAVAEGVGIRRGADLVFYLFVLLFLGACFYFYARLVRVQRQMTQLVRHIALQEAELGGAEEPKPTN
jgi:hypothetical protein